MVTYEEISESLEQLLEDQGTPRNVREKVKEMLAAIKEGGDTHVIADRLLMQLEEMQSDVNIPSYIRTQMWSVSSMLENLD